MCIRAGRDELESVKNLMAMSLMAVVAEALDADLDEISEEARLVEDLHMDQTNEQELKAMIADVFNGLEVDLNTTRTVSGLLDKVVLNEFAGLEGITEPMMTQVPQLASYPVAHVV
jgi:hypothetical protein